MALKISQLTSIGWALLPRLEKPTPSPFSLTELEAAIADRKVMDLLLKLDDDNGFIATAIHLGGEQINDAMSDAGASLAGRWTRKTGVEANVTCCVLAMLLEAIQQNFRE